MTSSGLEYVFLLLSRVLCLQLPVNCAYDKLGMDHVVLLLSRVLCLLLPRSSSEILPSIAYVGWGSVFPSFPLFCVTRTWRICCAIASDVALREVRSLRGGDNMTKTSDF